MLTHMVAVSNKIYLSFDLLYVSYAREISALFISQSKADQKQSKNNHKTLIPEHS